MRGDITPPEWFGKWQGQKRRDYAPRRKVTLKNAILVAVTAVAFMMVALGIGIIDMTGSFIAACPAALPGLGWLTVFFTVNKDRL